MRRLITSYILLLTGFVLFAQTNPLPSSIVPKQTAVSSDSLKTEAVIVKKVHRKLNMALDTLTLSDYTLSLERVNDNLNAIGDSSKLGFQVDNIANRIDFMTVDVKLIRQNFKGRHSVGHIKNQYLYQNYTALLDDETDKIQGQLDKMYHRVYHAKLHLKKVLSDSIFRKLYANKELRATFDDKLIRLEGKWSRTDSVTKASLDTLNALKIRLSDNSLILSNMLNIMDRRLDKSFSRLFGQEVNSLWQKEELKTQSKGSSKNSISIFKSEQNAIHFYLIQTSGERKVLILLAILLFGWLFIMVWKNSRKSFLSRLFLIFWFLASQHF